MSKIVPQALPVLIMYFTSELYPQPFKFFVFEAVQDFKRKGSFNKGEIPG